MKAKHFISALEEKKIAEAIGLAERKTSGEIRVFVSRRSPENALAAGQAEFERLGMRKTRERNAVLIYVAPEARKFAVIGDTAVHKKCGDVFWELVVKEMTEYFRREEFTSGVIHGIEKAGQLLAKHFPEESKPENQLPNDVEHD